MRAAAGGCARRPSRTVERGSEARSIAPGTDREGEGGSVVDSDSAVQVAPNFIAPYTVALTAT